MTFSESQAQVFEVSEDFELLALEQVQEGLAGRSETAPTLVAISVHSNAVPQLQWLASQKLYPKLYWRNRDQSVEIAGCGTAMVVSENNPQNFCAVLDAISSLIRQHPQGQLLNFFAATKFDPAEAQSTEWSSYPGLYLAQPEIAIVRRGDQYRIVLATLAEPKEAAAKITRRLARNLAKVQMHKPIDEETPAIVGSRDLPDRAEWGELCGTINAEFKARAVSKVVLASKRECELERPLQPFAVLGELQENNTSSYSFAFAPSPASAFVAVTPECLFHLQYDKLASDALGGTARRGVTPEQDREIGEALYSNAKISLEHGLVVEDIGNKFGELTRHYTADSQPALVKLAHLQHLLTRFSGEIKPGVSLGDIILTLSPTGAVSGNPPAAARSIISRSEPFCRGWYAGPVGLISADDAEFAVALRCFLSHGKQISFFAGAGIVECSTAAEEWQEVEDKINSSASLFPLISGVIP